MSSSSVVGAVRAKRSRELRRHLETANGRPLVEGEPGMIVMGQVAHINPASSEEQGWVAGTLLSDDGGARIPFTGYHLGPLRIGEAVRLMGSWDHHAVYGLQFKATGVQRHLPTTVEAVLRYIAANLKGCGPSRAAKLVAVYGTETLPRLLEDPSRAEEILGGSVGRVVAEQFRTLREEGDRAEVERALIVRLMSAGMTQGLATKAVRGLGGGTKAEAVVLQTPYRLTALAGVGFKTADRLARGMGVALNDPARRSAAIAHVVREAQGEGHTALPESAVLLAAAKLLQVDDPTTLRDNLQQAQAAGVLACVERDDQVLWYTPEALAHERTVAGWVVDMLHAVPDSPVVDGTVEAVVAESGLTEDQAGAVRMAITSSLSILTGRPGSGKTTTTKTIVAAATALGWRIGLVAPTGKAASRAAEVTGIPASTVHRMIIACERKKSPLDVDLLVIDEMSMNDLVTSANMSRMLIPGRTRVLVVGDDNQLPSVGHGQVLRDLLAVPAIPRATLTKVHRQGGRTSLIRENANRLLDNEPFVVSTAPHDDCWFVDITDTGHVDENGWPIMDDPDRSRREQELALEKVVSGVQYLAARRGANLLQDVQVLSPMRRGLLGTESLNRILAPICNPDGAPLLKVGAGEGTMVRMGDRVLQVGRNNYDVPGHFYNGEQGVVVGGDPEKGILTVQVDAQRTFDLRGGMLRSLQPAWGITVHRSQGSEFPFVILPWHTSHFVMLQNPEVLYTALTRAKTQFIAIGSQRTLDLARRFGQRYRGRTTGLGHEVRERLLGAPARRQGPRAG
jgi:exodeoxyribonuclease V alpha subunit